MTSRSLHPSAELPADIIAGLSYQFRTAAWQTRHDMHEHIRLMDLAQDRAEHIAQTGQYQHYMESQDGRYRLWPNQMLMDMGYRLPGWWPLNANYIESLAIGYLTAAEALEALHASPAHTKHMQGLDFWADHTCYGVGYSRRGLDRVWVIITAPPEPAPPVYNVYLSHISKPVVADSATVGFDANRSVI